MSEPFAHRPVAELYAVRFPVRPTEAELWKFRETVEAKEDKVIQQIRKIKCGIEDKCK
jgi:hypothetical protein